MTSSIQPNIIIVAGPTASGKSGVALCIAEIAQKKNINSIIINADSQQMYEELRVLSARPSIEDEQAVAHKLYGILPGSQPCSAGKWLDLARMEIDWALSQHILPIIVGGTGLYLRSLMQGIADIPDIDPQVRLQARNDLEAMGNEAFHERLQAVDPILGAKLHKSDAQRMLRAYEVWLGSGKALSWWQEQGATPPYPSDYFKVIQMDIDRESLYQRCDARFDMMLEQGALDEVKALLAMELDHNLPVMKSLGVPELAAYLKGECSLEDAKLKSQQVTRNYAKRQMTWFRNQLAEGIKLQGMQRDKLEKYLT